MSSTQLRNREAGPAPVNEDDIAKRAPPDADIGYKFLKPIFDPNCPGGTGC